jgi:hypothetical protein
MGEREKTCARAQWDFREGGEERGELESGRGV